MRGFPLDGHSADALLDGRVVADDAPPGYQHVARLVHAAKAPATAGEVAGEDHVVATLAAAVGEGTGVSGATHEGRRPVLTKLLSAKMAAAAAAAVLGGGAAAAATGSLPTSLQAGVSHGLSAVGISVPDPSAHSSARTDGSTGTTTPTTTAVTTTPPTQAVGPSASGPAAYGLCTAYAASSGSQAASHSVAFRNLAAVAKAKGETVPQYCAGITPPSPAPSSTDGSGTGSPSSDATPPANPSGTHVPATASDHADAGAGNSTDNPSGTHVPATASDHADAGAGNSTGNPSGSTGNPSGSTGNPSGSTGNPSGSTGNPSGTHVHATNGPSGDVGSQGGSDR